MKPLIRNKLFNYIDEHVGTNLEQWQQLQTALQMASGSSAQQNLSTMLVALLQESKVHTQVLDLPQIAISGLSTGTNPRTLLLYLPIYHSHHLAPLIYSLAAVQAYQAASDQLPITIKWLLDF